ncbi:hypothetical protein [Flagellimonas myxillae]|uniref:hypothetical protein n=1 Tax=Flagellimonas myxillae TaxID=2942214 RepID=UPI00201EFEBC|nr:hypothetical protein [Muricauda myxillae]MCL6267945.1 hypothetical protein [Muricauda myxillae]
MGTDKELEKLVDRLMEEAPLETPSSNFTFNVMQEVAKQQAAVVSRPLISKRAIFIALTSLAIFAVYLFSIGTGTEGVDGQYLELLTNTKSWFAERLPQLQFSKTLSYMVGAVGLMVCFQALVLKRYFNNRWA